MVIVDNDEIIEVVDTGLGGNRNYFSYDIISMTQGDFIAAYCSAHTGNGYLELVSISEYNGVKYRIPDAVDGNYEEMRLTAIEYGLVPEYDSEWFNKEDVKASAVYLGGKLQADYVDYDQDGNTDIVLTGIQRIYEERNKNERVLRQEFHIRSVFLYDSNIDDFVFGEEFSEKTPVKVSSAE